MIAFALLTGFYAVTATAAATAVEDGGKFDILTYNIAGLPALFSSSEPDVNIAIISPRLNNFTIVHVQEDWAYHADLLLNSTHAYRTTTSGNAPVGSGLNTLSAYPFSSLRRIQWSACWNSAGDCLTPKGFAAMRVQLAAGVAVDFYNLHGDAGDDPQDFVSRTAGFEQLSSFMSAYSSGNAVVVAGDWNCRYTSPGDPTRLLEEQNGLTDVWVDLERGGVPPAAGSGRFQCPFPVAVGKENTTCELIDKVQYRGSPLVKLRATAFRNQNADFLRPNDSTPLSDHFPVQVVFEYSLSAVLRAGDTVVGNGTNATWFNGIAGMKWEDEKAGVVATDVTLRGAGGRLDGIDYRLSDKSSVVQGRAGGENITLSLAEKENLNSVQACVETAADGRTTVEYLKLSTDRGRSVEKGGKKGECTTWVPPRNGVWTLAGFQGSAGERVESIGVVWGFRGTNYTNSTTATENTAAKSTSPFSSFVVVAAVVAAMF